ncbi:ferritin [Candidatus Peregrinibacteria bacterium]|nr:MAG: ferritin [Candidatus Peregrinibacteria bacterium]
MMNAKVAQAINDQIKNELQSAYIYLSMASWCVKKNLDGFAQWMKVQAKEETGHAMRLFEYLHNRGADVELQALEKPRKEWGSVADVFRDVFEHEKEVTDSINRLVDLSIAEKEHATKTILHWFLEEQVEEESTAQKVLERLELIGKDPAGILFLDKEMGARA